MIQIWRSLNFECTKFQENINVINNCILTNLRKNWYLAGPETSDLETTSGVNGKDPAADYGEAYATYDENIYVSIFFTNLIIHMLLALIIPIIFWLIPKFIYALYT